MDRHREKLDQIESLATRRRFVFSYNDVLVQIALPLVLILAIATRLMMISQMLAAHDHGPVILDLWKQQLILRIERVLDAWAGEAGLAAFPDITRVRWDGRWPADDAFAHLCRQGRELAQPADLAWQLYRRALRYRPSDLETGVIGVFYELYDPLESTTAADGERVPQEFHIDESRRDFALQFIQERCRHWHAQLTDLQWALVERVADGLPVEDPLSDARPAHQLDNIAAALAARGYPLLPAVAREYRGAN